MSNIHDIPVYLIHYTKLSNRLKSFASVSERVGLSNVEIVSRFDSECLDTSYFNSGKLKWSSDLLIIRDVLIANALQSSLQNSSYLELIDKAKSIDGNPPWMDYRTLINGEISVLMKHLYALTSISQSPASHGIIFEDDVLCHDNTEELFNITLQSLTESIHYIDLAGGCGLHPCSSLDELQKMPNMALLGINRTRTNAAYLVSRNMARFFVDNFLPFALPIDWHLQSILNYNSNINVFWTLEPIFLHGSETNLFKSWRD